VTEDDANTVRWCLLEGRRLMHAADRHDALSLFQDGVFEDFEEMESWVSAEPTFITEYDLSRAGQERLKTAANMRTAVQKHGHKWRPSVCDRWLARAAQIESGHVDDIDKKRWNEAGRPIVPFHGDF
jgi:hypothetical protein